jgi:transcription elongation factor GreA
MKEELEKLVTAGKINRTQLEPLVQLAQSGFCMHRSWGFGRVTTVDTVLSRLTIDFQGKPGHSMDLGFAADSLKPIPPDHILAKKVSDLAGLRQMAALHHLDLIKLVLRSYDGRATLDQVQQVLVPEVIADDWKKWWEVARREMKKDGHFQLPIKKSDPIIYHEEEVSLKDSLLNEFRGAKGLKARLVVINEMMKSLEDVEDVQTVAADMITALNMEIASHQRTQPGVALEAVFARDDLRTALKQAPHEGEVTEGAIWALGPSLAQVCDQIPTQKHKRTLQSFKDANPESWADPVLELLQEAPARLCGECVQLLLLSGLMEQLKATLSRLISQHQAGTELLLWLAKEQRSDTYADILGPEVFRAMLTAIERDQFNEKKSNRLRDHILDDQELVADLIEAADIDVVKDLVRALQFSPAFDDMDKRSVLARIVKTFPAVQSLISGEQTKQDAALLVSWESLERRKKEYEELVQKKIPANSKDIAIARSYGDLRENHEYKAAKEMQKVLMRRKHELESQLTRARGVDFVNVSTEAVSLGTRVVVTDLINANTESYAIVGAWDGDPEKGIVSYLTPLGQSLLNRKVGEEVEFTADGVGKRYRIDSISLYQPAPAPGTIPAAEMGSSEPEGEAPAPAETQPAAG